MNIKTRIRVEEYSDGSKYHYPEYFAKDFTVFGINVIKGKWISIPDDEGFPTPVRRVRLECAEKLIKRFLSTMEEEQILKNRKLVKSYINGDSNEE